MDTDSAYTMLGIALGGGLSLLSGWLRSRQQERRWAAEDARRVRP